jgi:DNA-binding response OmpR family regulator
MGSLQEDRMLPGKRILVVDDEVLFAENLRDYLSRRRAQVMLVGSGEAALDASGSFCPDAVIIADRLPERGGVETCEALKMRLPPFHCILLTDRGETLPANAWGAAVDGILEKPFSLADLQGLLSAGFAAAANARSGYGYVSGSVQTDLRFGPRLRHRRPAGDRSSLGAVV